MLKHWKYKVLGWIENAVFWGEEIEDSLKKLLSHLTGIHRSSSSTIIKPLPKVVHRDRNIVIRVNKLEINDNDFNAYWPQRESSRPKVIRVSNRYGGK